MSTETKMKTPFASTGLYNWFFMGTKPHIVKGINKNPRFIHTNKNKNANTATISKNTNR